VHLQCLLRVQLRSSWACSLLARWLKRHVAVEGDATFSSHINKTDSGKVQQDA